MRTAAGLALLAAGAILTFAVSARVPGVNLRLAGLIIMVTGIAALIAPSRAAGWLRHRIGVPGELGHPAAAEADDGTEAAYSAYPPFLLQDPAVLAAEVLNSVRAGGTAQAGAGHGTARVPGQRAPAGIERDSEA